MTLQTGSTQLAILPPPYLWVVQTRAFNLVLLLLSVTGVIILFSSFSSSLLDYAVMTFLKRWIPLWAKETSNIKKKLGMGEWRGKAQIFNTQLIIHYITLSLSLSPPPPSLSVNIHPSPRLFSHFTLSLSLSLSFTDRLAIQTSAVYEKKSVPGDQGSSEKAEVKRNQSVGVKMIISLMNAALKMLPTQF